MNIKNILLPVYLIAVSLAQAQSGNLQVSFTPHNGGKAVSMQLVVPLFKFDNPHGFWFINPHNGDRHLQFQPDRGWGDRNSDVAFITINDRNNDFDFYDGGRTDSNSIAFRNKVYIISAPQYNVRDGNKNKPLHIHINSFTASECSFTVSGEARLGTVQNNTRVAGILTGNGHLYREAKYDKSDVLPGCDCDPAIYAALYDEENNVRTSSACENALKNKIFDAVQKAMAPLFTNFAFKGKGAMAAGQINIVMLPGHIDINVPVKDRPYCSSDYRHNALTGIDAHKKIFNSDDAYGVRFVKMPTQAELSGGSADPNIIKRQAAVRDSGLKLVMAGKMSADQFKKAMEDVDKKNNVEAQDMKKMEMDHNLYITILINPRDRELILVKTADKTQTAVQHNVKGAAFEIFSPQKKDASGDWTGNRLGIYFGKFDNPAAGKSGGGFDAEVTNAVYPANGNKLSVYNIIIKMDGDKDLENKAVANIDFDALQKLITHQ